MSSPFTLKQVVSAFVVTAALATSSIALAAADAPARVRGTISKISGDTVEVKVRGGKDVVLTLDPTTAFLTADHAAISDIKSDSFIGTAAVPQADGTLKALEVTVFPAGMKPGEGHYPWDLGPKSTMTNGTVGDVVVAQGRTITVKYPNGEKKILVPADVPVVLIGKADRSALVAGAHAVFFLKKAANGGPVVGNVIVGKGSVVPPM